MAGSPERAALLKDEHDDHLSRAHQHLVPRHAHGHHFHENMRLRRENKREPIVQTALDIIVVSAGTTVGDVLLQSIPSNPTTASIPGYGELTLSSITPATDISSTVTTAAALAIPTASSGTAIQTQAPASNGSSTAYPTGRNTTSSVLTSTTSSPPITSTATSVGWNFGMASAYNSSSATTSISSSSLTSSLTTTSTSSSVTSFMTSTTFYTSEPATTSTNGGAAIGGAGIPASTGTTSPTPATSSDNSTNPTPPAGTIAGGVVGGVAGAAVLAVLFFVLIRYLRQRQAKHQRLENTGDDDNHSMSATAGTGSTAAPMAQRSSFAPIAAAVARLRPDNTRAATAETTGPVSSERGFQKVSGRKLTSVLQSGGDGYAEPMYQPGSAQAPAPAAAASGIQRLDHASTNRLAPQPQTRNQQQLSPDASALAQGPTTNRSSSIYESPATGNPFATPSARADRALPAFSSSPGSDSSDSIRSPTPGIDEALRVHEGPVRTPVITTGPDSPPPPSSRRQGPGPDALGRSRPELDGSRPSRFSEAI